MADSNWIIDKNWAEKFLPEIKRILGYYLIGPAPEEEDMKRNTDLIVLNMCPLRIACRIRRYHYFLKYPDEITIRQDRPSGIKSELTKLIEGWGDYFFYGFSNEQENSLISWKLCDLYAFRIWFQRACIRLKSTPGGEKTNRNGSSNFRFFNAFGIPDFIKYQSIKKGNCH